ncbi:serine/threonine kinase receptor associated protein [Pseudohyphozyma bogoriensis]|nr:serine/threonine kinase receptor associated protein [Pseudohyphozyma bogoriensis]
MANPVKSTPLVCSGHTRPVGHLHFSPLLTPHSPLPDANATDPHYLLVSSCKDSNAMLRAVWSSRISEDGLRAVTGSADFTANCLTTLPHNHIVRTVDLNRGSTRVLSGGHEKKLRIWDLSRAPSDGSDASLDDVLEFKNGEELAHAGTIKSAVWDEKRSSAVSFGEDKVVRWWDLRTLQPTHSITFTAPITSMEKSHDGELLSITSGNDVTFLSLESRLPYLTHTLDYAPSTASIHPITRETFVTGETKNGWVRVHDAQTGEEREVGKGHHGPVHCISYSPDGECYASGSEDGTIRLWQSVPKTYGLWRLNEGANGLVEGTS